MPNIATPLWRSLMPYKSDAQRRFFNANRKQLEAQGVSVDEYNEASKGMQLPERAPKANRREARRNSRTRKSRYDFLKRQGGEPKGAR